MNFLVDLQFSKNNYIHISHLLQDYYRMSEIWDKKFFYNTAGRIKHCKNLVEGVSFLVSLCVCVCVCVCGCVCTRLTKRCGSSLTFTSPVHFKSSTQQKLTFSLLNLSLCTETPASCSRQRTLEAHSFLQKSVSSHNMPPMT